MQKASKITAVVVVSVIIISACQNTKKSEFTETKTQEVVELKDYPSVCIWDKGAVRTEASRNGKWLSSMALGEKVTWLGKSKIDSTDINRKYMQIRLSDGTEGWVSEYVIVTDATPAVVVKKASIYRRPDMITITDKEYKSMDLVAIVDTKNEWIEVVGEQKKLKGWIQLNTVTSKEADIAVALLAKKAFEEKDLKTKKEKINSIINNPQFTNSVFIKALVSELNEIVEETTTEEVPYVTN